MHSKKFTQKSHQNQVEEPIRDIICPMSDTICTISKSWTLLILWHLKVGKKRFNKIIEELGNISPKTLTKRLRELEDHGLVDRKRFNEIPPRVEYSLNQKGVELIKCFKYLDIWHSKWNYEK
ncbi:MAG: putative HTH-type transcriptional regulator YybR [Candidatus Heimdallarchaeota archaeon LC_3]|nr:MAG: putative HTH-type transcriptional regulator YybR [Candidatus Heimdallarchaeota archaeon LC_3]